MSTIKKQARVQRTAHRKDVARKHRVNVADKNERRERVTTAVGLFVALIKERGFVRCSETGKYSKRMDDGTVHTIVLDYIPGKTALLIINPGAGQAGDLGECAHSVHYDECPLPTKTIEYLQRKVEQVRRAARPNNQRQQPAWKRELKDAACIVEMRALLGSKE
jgi:hypothetical protein